MTGERLRKFANEALKFLRSDKLLWFKFRRHPAWITRFVIDGRAYGGWYDLDNDPRLSQFRAAFPGAERILELGSLEGGHSFHLARLPGVKEVTALEGRDFNIRKAEFIRALKGVDNVRFVLADLERDSLEQFGSFDVTFSLGLLYHLPEPWAHLKEVRKVSSNLFLWTHCVNEDKVNAHTHGYPGWIYREYGFQDPLSGLSPTSYWPTLEGLKRMLADCGFPHIEIITLDAAHRDGPAVTLAARAERTA